MRVYTLLVFFLSSVFGGCYDDCVQVLGANRCQGLLEEANRRGDGGAPEPGDQIRRFSIHEADDLQAALDTFLGPQGWKSRVFPNGHTYLWDGESIGMIYGKHCKWDMCVYSCAQSDSLDAAINRGVNAKLPVSGIPQSPQQGAYHGVLGVSLVQNAAERAVYLTCFASETATTLVAVRPDYWAIFIAAVGRRIEQKRPIGQFQGALGLTVESWLQIP